MFTLDQVRCFVAVAEHLHFGRAAESLSMTQPPLSRQIQKLEKSVGVALIARDNRSVGLTLAGQQFLNEARRLLSLASRAPERAKLIAEGVAGNVTIGFTAGSGMSQLGALVSMLSEKLPGVKLSLSEMVTKEQIRALAEGRIDIGIGRPSGLPDDQQSILLEKDDLVLAIPSDLPALAGLQEVESAEVANFPVIMHSPVHARYFYDLVVRYFDIDHQGVVQTLSQMTSMLNLVSAGIGVAFVPSSLQKMQMQGVRYVEVSDVPAGIVELHAIWDTGSTNTALFRVLETVRSESLDPRA